MNKYRLAVYGSLRKGMGNHFFMSSGKFIKKVWLKGWDMYSLRVFPYVVPTDNNNNILVELYETDKDSFRPIHEMETGAGYHYTTVIVDGEQWLIYYFPDKLNTDEEKVVGGDWNEYKTERDRNKL